MSENKGNKDIYCPVEYGLSMFAGKWKPRIIYTLALADAMRYSEIRRQIGGITDAVLTNALKELILDDIIIRQAYDEMPPRVEYRLTEKGKSIVPVLQHICEWSHEFFKNDSCCQFAANAECKH